MKINILKENIKAECGKYGEVKKVNVYDVSLLRSITKTFICLTEVS